MNRKKRKVLRELLMNDAFIHYFFWSLILLVVLSLLRIPQSLGLVLTIFFGAVSIVCFPYVLYRVHTALYLVRKGIEIVVEHISVEHILLGTRIRFEYEYAGKKYIKTKCFQTVWFPDKEPPHMKLLIDPKRPSSCAILELKRRSVFSIIKNRNV